MAPETGIIPTPGTIGPWLLPYLAARDAVYLTGEESLRVRSFNAAAGVVLQLEGRMLAPTGEIVPIAAPMPTTADRVAQLATHAIGAGWIQHIQVRAAAGTPRVGQCFVVVEIVRGQTGAFQSLGVLLQGYVTDTAPLAWPGTPLRPSAEGPGVIRSIAGTNPGVGAEISETVPPNARWRLRSIVTVLATDATVANRETVLLLDDGAAIYAAIPTGVNQAASLSRTITFAQGVDRFALATAAVIAAPAPDVVLMGGHRIRTSTANLQAGDDYAAPQLLVEEWIED